MNDIQEMPNLPSLMNAQYKKAEHYLKRAFWVKGIMFVVNLIVILIPKIGEINLAVWTVFGLSIIAILLDNNYQDKFRQAYDIGEKVRKLDLIRKVFPVATNKTEEAYVFTQISKEVLEYAKNNPKEVSKYYSDKDEKYEILAEHIQENSFWTSSLMELHSIAVRKILITIFLTIFISLVAGLYLLSEFSDSNKNLSLNVSQYLALLINTFFAFNILNYYNSFRRKSTQLKEIDAKLEGRKAKPQVDELFINFAEYNCILYDAYPTPEKVYDLHGKRLNAVWKIRVDSDS